MKISIFGLGYVGCVSLGCLAQNGFEMAGVDVNKTKVDLINQGLPTIIEKDIDRIIREQHALGRIKASCDYVQPVLQSDVSIICVGTPSTEKGNLDLEYIYNTAAQIGEALKGKEHFHTVVIRSTVLPGTNRKVGEIISEVSGKVRNEGFAVVSNPEFLREGSAVEDYYNPPFTLVGSDNARATKVMRELYSKINGEFVEAGIPAAELIKYINNSFHALKVTFANEVGNICKRLEIDSHEVMKLFCLDKQLNISPYYFRPGFAYGGSCLPKDLKALKTLATDFNMDSPVLRAIEPSNQNHIRIATELIKRRGVKKIGILGISFKEGTDDLRYSPILNVIEGLLESGFDIRAHDDNVNAALLIGSNKDYLNQTLPFLEKLIMPTEEEVMDWAEVIVFNRKMQHYPELVAKRKNTHFIDLVKVGENIRSPNYEGICW
jgi:GDP-mannose 6-dehydrogenase